MAQPVWRPALPPTIAGNRQGKPTAPTLDQLLQAVNALTKQLQADRLNARNAIPKIINEMGYAASASVLTIPPQAQGLFCVTNVLVSVPNAGTLVLKGSANPGIAGVSMATWSIPLPSGLTNLPIGGLGGDGQITGLLLSETDIRQVTCGAPGIISCIITGVQLPTNYNY